MRGRISGVGGPPQLRKLYDGLAAVDQAYHVGSEVLDLGGKIHCLHLKMWIIR